jgi:phosphopantothenoylcysteine decarboxylase/phosphopantothenate--cysteine ligase
MYEACMAEWPQAHFAILCAAVADFTPASTADEKIKKQPGQTGLELRLSTTPDIAKSLGESKRPDQTLIGFALETQNEKENALAKRERKRMDAIVLNSLRNEGAGFGTDTNRVTILSANGNSLELPLQSKADIAARILDFLT